MSPSKAGVHLNLHFSIVQVLWTLTFAGLLVLLVVLLGRDRVNRFPWFTASTVLVALRMLASRLLYGKLAPLTSNEVFLTLADVGAVLSFMVAVEIARRAFGRASRTAWIAGTVVLLAIAVTVMVFWGPWPAAKTLFAHSMLADLRLMQMVAQKGDLLTDLLIVELGLLVAFAGRSFHAGWRSHTQRIVLGLSTASIAQLLLRVALQAITNGPAPKSQEEYQRLTGLQDKLFNANGVVFLVVVVWWIVCLWIDEPGAAAADTTARIPGAAAEPAEISPEI
jgi:hypothetical protein